MLGITIAIIAFALAVSARFSVVSHSMTRVLHCLMLVIVAVFLNQVIAYFSLAFMVKWCDYVVGFLFLLVVLMRDIVHTVLRKFLVSLLAFALFLSRYIVALSIRIILSPLPSLVATLPRALEDRSSIRDWFNRGFRHLACGLLHAVLFVTWDCRASLILDIGYLACYFVYNVKFTVELFIGHSRNIPGYRLPLPSLRQAFNWLFDVIKRSTGTIIKVMILAFTSVSDLLSDTARHRQPTSKPSLSARRPRTPGIETVEVRRLPSPFAPRPVQPDGVFSRWYKTLWMPRTGSSTTSSETSVDRNQPFANIPTAPIRRIDNVFVDQDGTSSSSFFAKLVTPISSLFKPESSAGYSVELNDRCPYPPFERERSSFDSDDGSDSDSSVDDLVSGLRSISLGPGSPQSSFRYKPEQQHQRTHIDRAVFQQRYQNQMEQEQRAQEYARQSAYNATVYRSKLSPVPTSHGVTLAPLKDLVASLWNYSVKSNTGYGQPVMVNPSMPSGDAVYHTLTAGHSQDLKRVFGLKSAMKGGRARYSLTRHDIYRKNKVVFQEEIQVKSVTSWIDTARDIHQLSRDRLSREEKAALKQSVFWLEQERMAGLL